MGCGSPAPSRGSTTVRRSPTLLQWFTCPGVFCRGPSGTRPRAMLTMRPDRLARKPRRARSATRRAPSRRRSARGTGTCSSTSIAEASSNSPSPNGSVVASCTRYSRFRPPALSATRPRASGSGRSMPTMRPSPILSAHSAVRTPLAAADVEDRLRRGPVRTARRGAGVEAGHEPAHDRVRRAVLVEGVGPVGTASAVVLLTASMPLVRRSFPVAPPEAAPVVLSWGAMSG